MRAGPKVPLNRLRDLAHEEFVRQFPQGVKRAEPPQAVNAEVATGVDRPRVLLYRGRVFVVPPIPFEDGVDLHEIKWRILRPESTDDYRDACREAVALMGKLAHRRGWRGRLRWILPNPFRGASEGEISEVLDFFWMCRTGLRFPAWLDKLIGLVEQTGSVASTNSKKRTAGSRRPGATTPTG